ncbi:MAG: hypothetical protein HYZ61_02445 [Candidatus Andersenbacteria bacterium]|nr:hypothetical protein [Candidatus Andersenbacteria bacterium]
MHHVSKELLAHQFEVGIWLIISAFYIVNVIPLALHGPFNADEGWYLYNAWQTWEGRVPYLDFAFPQPPATLIIHGFFQEFFGPGFYLGRLINAGLSFLAIAAFASASRRLWGVLAGVCTGLILVASPLWLLHSVSVSTYATAALFLGLELLAIAYKRPWLVGFLAVSAMSARLTIAPTALLLFIPIFFTSFRLKTLFQIVAGCICALTIIVAPLAIIAPQKAWINIIGYHTYMRAGLATSSIERHVEVIMPFLQEQYLPVYQWFWIAALVGVILAVRRDRTSGVVSAAILTTVFINALLHATAINATYDVPLIPLLVVAASSGIGFSISSLTSSWQRRAAFTVVAVVCIGILTYSQAFLALGEGEREEGHTNIHRLAQYIQSHTTPDEYIFTPELYVAVEAQRRSLPGSELGRFFYFPELTDAEAQKRGVVNDDLFTQMVTSRHAKYIVVSMAQFWNNVTDHEHQHQLMSVFDKAGYVPVLELQKEHPAIEATRLYERQ